MKPPVSDTSDSLAEAIDPIITDLVLPDLDPAIPDVASRRDIFAVKTRKAWDKSSEARCDFKYHPGITRRGDVWFLYLWKKSVVGRTLSDIKSDPAEIPHFANAVSDFLFQMIVKAMWQLLNPLHKNLLFITGINNKL